MADGVVKRAVREARDVSRLAVDAAKTEIIEKLTPELQRIIDGRLRDGVLGEDVDRLRRAADGYGETEFEEGTEMKGKKDESVASLFPGIVEMDEMAYGSEEEQQEAKGAGEEEMEEAKGEEEMDEEIEISESELEAMYAEALQLEVDVSKGFKDMEKAKDMGGTDPLKAHALTDPGNMTPVKSGEHPWQNEEPPHKKGWIPESKVKALFNAGLAENKALKAENRKLTEMVRKMHSKLSEMNLLNSKILHVNQFLTRNRLTSEQKRTVIESIDKGTTVEEVKRIYSVLEGSFKAVGAVTESRKPRGDAQKRRTSGAPDPKVLRESADRQGEGGGMRARWLELAQLTSGK